MIDMLINKQDYNCTNCPEIILMVHDFIAICNGLTFRCYKLQSVQNT